MGVLAVLGIVAFCIWFAMKSQEEAEFKRRQDKINQRTWDVHYQCKKEFEKRYGKKD